MSYRSRINKLKRFERSSLKQWRKTSNEKRQTDANEIQYASELAEELLATEPPDYPDIEMLHSDIRMYNTLLIILKSHFGVVPSIKRGNAVKVRYRKIHDQANGGESSERVLFTQVELLDVQGEDCPSV